VEVDPVARAVEQRRLDVLDAGLSGLAKVQQEGPSAPLSPDESTGLEAIILTVGRPAIMFRDGHFDEPPTEWNVLDQSRDRIEKAARSIGRIQVVGNPLYPWVGTGFLVAEGVVMTNRHVAKVFSAKSGDGAWMFQAGMSANVDCADAPDADPPMQFDVGEVIGIHDTLDMALLRVTPLAGSGDALPNPLPIASSVPPAPEGRQVYTIGYPARDPRNGEALMRSIFADIYGVKRLQPGTVMAVFPDDGTFNHDCSTLGGNSGSCVVDLQTHQVIGLHFEGYYLQYNRAFSLWALTDDPLLKKAGVTFA